MTEADFLNAVLQAAGVHPKLQDTDEPSQFTKSWVSEGPWESAAQVEIAHHLRRGYGITTKIREISYPEPYSSEKVDFYFELQDETYAIEIKVESTNGLFGGANLQESITRDVYKLGGFVADHRWVVVIATSQKNCELLDLTLNRGDSWSRDVEGQFKAYLCNIDTYPHGLPIDRSKQLSAPFNFITNYHK
ncbi:hypothetical protein V9L13_03845 [Pseudomonas sp. RSB 5.4]|uniref:Uncharacterized protein n=1 Tax=Pseudomonas fluorescens R124 TaxID=743713 RepID=A0A7U9GSA7_PSEFL|nr:MULTISPECIES: hypothetical protein [Pseudomonas]EJZ57834.1 hypothetical protein I1A_002159 [Pseudomonas fluorescens R124]MCU1773659.1 hypothetical protein [Pseudomonas sp. 13B_3.2_Bac1]